MTSREVYRWLTQSPGRQELVVVMAQPMTALQLSRRLQIVLDRCTYLLWELAVHGVVECLNTGARKSRLYWLTPIGRTFQARLRKQRGLPALEHAFPTVDWDLYGWVIYKHRAAIIRALSEPLRPPGIKRKAVWQNAGLRISCNNVREVLKLFCQRGVVSRVYLDGGPHAHYALTDVGRDLRTLLLGAGVTP
jgi:hypothetical protein